MRSQSNFSKKSISLILTLALSVPFLSQVVCPAAVLAQGVETGLKQGAPEPLDRDDSITGGGDDERKSVLPPLQINGPKVGDSSDSELREPDQASAVLRMPTHGSSEAKDGGETQSQTAVNPESGLPTTASIAATGPLNLSLPNNEFIFPGGPNGINGPIKLHVTENADVSPLLSGSVQTIPDGVKVDLTLQGNLNSEVSQKGSEVFAQISKDVTDASGNKVYLPGGWVAHGFVTDRSGQGHHSKAGWAEVTFDRIISPDGKYDIPFEAKLSTKDNTVVAVTKVLATDTKYMSIGAAAGSVLSVQLTGIPLAVASHGYSVAIGAGIGAAIGLFGAVRKKGPILSVYPGEHLQLKTAGNIQMPGFNLANLPSAKKPERVIGLYMQINKATLLHEDIFGDKKSRVLQVNFTIANNSPRDFLLNNIRVVSELDHVYYPHVNALRVRYDRLAPKTSQTLEIPFSVDAGKHQYSLLLTDASGKEVRREPIKIR